MIYPLNDLLDSLFVTLHLQEGLDLTKREVLPISKSNQLVKGTQQFKGISCDFPLV